MLRNLSISKSDSNEKDLVPIEVEESSATDLEARSEDGPIVDAVFGLQDENGPAYRSLGWIGAAVLMTKSQIGLGVLTIPSTLTVVGVIPGMIIIFGRTCSLSRVSIAY